MYQVIILPTAIKDLSRIDKTIVQRITDRLNWLSENIESITQLSLRASLIGFFKLRIGDWRVIYEVDHDKKVITVHKVGHRKDIYK